MNDEAAFVAAIAAAPDDDHLPFVFADWLDDRGDPRGQWVRNSYVHPWMRPTYESPVPKLLQSLAGGRRVIEVRRAAQVIGAPIVPGLVELLKHEKPRVRQQACMCLRNIGKRAAEAVPALLAAMSDPDGDVRTQAAKALKDIGPASVTDTDPLKAALTDDNWNVRQVASKVLGSMRAKGRVLQELTEQFNSPDAGDRLNAIEGLAQLVTADVIPVLDRAIDDPSAEVRERAVDALGRLKFTAAVPLLCRAMRDPLARVRKAAAGRFGSQSWQQPITAAAAAALIEVLGDAVPEVRAAACYGLVAGKAGAVRPLVPHIVALLGDFSPDVVRAARLALGEIAKGDTGALAALIAELKSPDALDRRDAVYAVAAVGKGDPAALAALASLFTDPDEEVAFDAVRGAVSGWEKLPAALEPVLLARFARARADVPSGRIPWALRPLGRLESASPAVVAALREFVSDPLQDVTHELAIVALGQLGPTAVEAVPDLVALLVRDEQAIYFDTYCAAVGSLVRLGPRGVAELSALLDGGNEQACRHVPEALSELGPAGAPLLPALLRMCRTDDVHRRGRALDGIRALGPAAVAALPDLIASIDGPATASVLGVIQGFGAALLPHLPKLTELAEKPEFGEHLNAFAQMFASLAPAEAARAPLRAVLRRAVAPASDGSPAHPYPHARRACAAALAKYRDATLVPDLVPLATDPDPTIRAELAGHLLQFDTPVAVSLLRQLLTDTEDGVRVRAADALALIADESDETVAALVLALEDRFPKVRGAAADALGKLDVATATVLTALQAAVGDEDKRTAARASVALRKLDPKAKAEPKNARAPAKGKKKPG